MSHLLRGTFSLAISIALAWLIYVWVEKPCARLRRKLSD
jgi:peptidoglycan/LPS O-acetylase OafA/YrhL